MKRLRDLKWTKHVLQGDRRKAVEELLRHGVRGQREVVSADLTAASDRILHSHAIALWKGIIRAMEFSPDLEEVVLDSMGPQYLIYPEGG